MIRFKNCYRSRYWPNRESACEAFFWNKWRDYYLSRRAHAKSGNVKTVNWNGRDVGNWSVELEGADLLINLAGTSVNCRHTPKTKAHSGFPGLMPWIHLQKLLNFANPPSVWIQASAGALYKAGHGPLTKTIYQWNRIYGRCVPELGGGI